MGDREDPDEGKAGREGSGYSLPEQEVLVDTFVARLKASTAISRGDAFQATNYSETVYRLTSGEFGYLTAAATGESLALTVIKQVVDYASREHVANVLLGDIVVPGYSDKRLSDFLAETLNKELSGTLGEQSTAFMRMVWEEVNTLAMDASLGKNSKAFKLFQERESARKSTKLLRALEAHTPWIAKLLGETIKTMRS